MVGNAPFLLLNTLIKLAKPKICSDLFPSLRWNKITFLECRSILLTSPSRKELDSHILLFQESALNIRLSFPSCQSKSGQPQPIQMLLLWGLWEPALLIINIPSELEHPCCLPYHNMQHFNIKQPWGRKKREGMEEKKKRTVKFLSFGAWRGSNPVWKDLSGQLWTELSGLGVSSDRWAGYSQIPHPPLINDFSSAQQSAALLANWGGK